ncbi:DNA ligase [Uliginosibacterium sp. TH139]|uniref:DNA ligase n=1 Tax=Uliginosibacterium sp. TH139 TaxID=2067453 RepID=UPI000C7ACCE4|nr:DNA ligase [Uliginosibacterium sp. TH139]PLK49583.1 DNA ligase [Uliginosibacterium sp. TH139]
MRYLPCLMLSLLLSLFSLHTLAAPEILLAELYRDGIDPGAYLVSEKLDGVRAIWDGQRLSFRSGHPVNAPDWFIQALPATPLDGELWAGRGTFERLSGIVRKMQPVDAEWRELRYMIFELPDAPGDFSARADAIRRLTAAAGIPWLQAVEQFRVADAAALRQRMAAVLKAGGEGLMLHRADAPYVTGRSDVLLKLKPWQDAEARVVGYVPGRGKHRGRLGALLVEAPDGRRFSLGSGFSDAQREAPPAPGALVTYRYQSLTAQGQPRHPVFLRQRAAAGESAE